MLKWNNQANEIYLGAIELDSPGDRERWLVSKCDGDRSLEDEVRQLLAAHERVGRFLETPLAQLPPELIPAANETIPQTVGPYKLVEQIGEGGMGIVYLATQDRPVRRTVALKIIKPGLDTRQVIARFEAERQALAMMEHRNIARVLEGGTTEKGHPYFVMELVKGVPITEFCRRERLTRKDRLKLFIDVCQAVQHAHQKGIIHRDLKPSNILVTVQDGLPIVKVIDFGIAKAVGESLTEHSLHTGFRQLIGTLLYMSPEQATFSAVDVDTRSDVYSLGVVLYELLTSTTPFELKAPPLVAEADCRRLICEHDPLAPSARISTISAAAISTLTEAGQVDSRKLRRQLRGELDWVVMKALDKNRNRRYESPSALASDLQRFLDHEPVQAGPPSTLYRLRKIALRNRGKLTTAALVLVAILVGAAASIWQAVEAESARRLANQERDKFRHLAGEYRELLYAGDMRLATQAWQRNDVPKMRELLGRHVPKEREKDIRGFEWHFLSTHVGVRSRDILQSEKPLYAIRFSPDGKFAAVAGASARIYLLDAAALEVRKVIETGQTEVNSVDFSQDGGLLASAGDDGTVALWNVASGSEVERFRAHGKAVFQVHFTDSDRSLWTASVDSRLRRWTTSQPTLEREITRHTASVESLASSKLGMIAAGSSDCLVTVWNGDQAEPLWVFEDYPKTKVNAVAFTPSGRILATGHDDGMLTLRRPDTGVLLAHQEYPDAINSIAYSPDIANDDVAWMAVGDRGGSIHLIPVDNRSSLSGLTGTTWRVLRGRHWNAHTGRVYSIAFTADGTQLLTAGEDGALRAWSLDTPANSRKLAPGITSFQPTGNRSALVTGDIAAELDIVTGDVLQKFDTAGLTLETGCYLKNCDQFLFADAAEQLTFFERGGGVHRRVNTVGHGSIREVAASADGRHFAAVCAENGGYRIELFSPSGVKVIPCQHLVHALEMAADGRHLIYDQEKDILVVDVATGELAHTLSGHRSSIWRLALAPDGEHLASCSQDRTLRIWNLDAGQEVWSEVAHAKDIDAIAMSPDAETIATSGGDGLLRLWRWRQGTLVFEYPLIDWPANRMYFSFDGRQLMVQAAQRLRVYDASGAGRRE